MNNSISKWKLAINEQLNKLNQISNGEKRPKVEILRDTMNHITFVESLVLIGLKEKYNLSEDENLLNKFEAIRQNFIEKNLNENSTPLDSNYLATKSTAYIDVKNILQQKCSDCIDSTMKNYISSKKLMLKINKADKTRCQKFIKAKLKPPSTRVLTWKIDKYCGKSMSLRFSNTKDEKMKQNQIFFTGSDEIMNKQDYAGYLMFYRDTIQNLEIPLKNEKDMTNILNKSVYEQWKLLSNKIKDTYLDKIRF
ncbi:hypothetical protein A3Q56_03320 [Intoshia linei]|uniref:Uncharacterized protein n=1 Tax=Intoshia linei TaxID=1819745 RepID=A0A177B469_9BILA|nr:hypothetical protein A3Q56_03320 [Intoshia linei]